jgi:hypothetical protein
LVLQVFVQAGCEPCAHARVLAERAADAFPGVAVDVIDIDEDDVDPPHEVFAVPSFLIDGQMFSLGNPSWEQLAGALDSHGETADGER